MATTYVLNATVYLPLAFVYDNLVSHLIPRGESILSHPWSLIHADEMLTLAQQRSVQLFGYTSKFYFTTLSDGAQNIAFQIIPIENGDAETLARITVSHPVGRFHPDDDSTPPAHLSLYRRCIKVAELLLHHCDKPNAIGEEQIIGFFRKLLGGEKEKRKR